MTRPILSELPLAEVKVNPRNPRGDMGPLEDLVASILKLGVLQPIVVVPNGKGYIAVAGSRRVLAARKAGLETIPAVVRELTPDQQEEAAIVENVVRLQMSPVEEALAYARMLKARGLNQSQLARLLGVTEYRMSRRLLLLRLDKETLQAVHDGRITIGQAIDEAIVIRDGRTPHDRGAPRGSGKKVHTLEGHVRCLPRLCEIRTHLDALDVKHG